MISNGTFSNGDRNTFAPLVADWLTKDYFMTLADFDSYTAIQSDIEALYRTPLEWHRKALINVANSGYFSSDRSIEDYLERIWPHRPARRLTSVRSLSVELQRGPHQQVRVPTYIGRIAAGRFRTQRKGPPL